MGLFDSVLITAFRVDTVQDSRFLVDQAMLESILADYHEVGEWHWTHGYSHVALMDNRGCMELEGKLVGWLVRPGGLCQLEWEDGRRLYLASSR